MLKRTLTPKMAKLKSCEYIFNFYFVFYNFYGMFASILRNSMTAFPLHITQIYSKNNVLEFLKSHV